jgi:ketosteroid isomerase-like protein
MTVTIHAESVVAQEHVALARSLFELQNHRQSDPAWLDKCVAAFAADCEVVSARGITLRGPEGYKRFLRFFLVESFPDLRAELTTVFATEDQVVLEGMYRGTTTGTRTLPTGALKASGCLGEPRCCFVLQISKGKITSLHAYYDLTVLLEQFDCNAATQEAT